MTIKVEFADVLDLVPQSTVKVNDVSVGKVTDIDLERLPRRGHARAPRATSSCPDNAVAEHPPDQPAGREVRRAERARAGRRAPTRSRTATTIPIERAGRNPEVEEVLGALSLLLNGGGVAQLKTITQELNMALEGREDSARSVLRQLAGLHGPARREQGRHRRRHRVAQPARDRGREAARPPSTPRSRSCPAPSTSIDRQRDDLVEMLAALNDLCDVGVDVIRRPRTPPSTSLERLDPVLSQLAASGRRLRQRLPRVPDLPVRRRGRRPRPAGRAQPAHGRLHQPVDHPRRRPHRWRAAPSRAADQPADGPRPDGDRRTTSWPASRAAR